MISKDVWGRWETMSADDKVPVQAVDCRAGHIVTMNPTGEECFGDPSDFTSEDGLSGNELMELLLPSPKLSDLAHGCLRETLANAASIARIGRNETRDWDGPRTYFADDNGGCITCIEFVGSNCIGLGYSDDPSRKYDCAGVIASLPDFLQPFAARRVAAPIFREQEQPFTAIFWSSNGRLIGLEPWHVLYTYTGDILEAELSSDTQWLDLAHESYELSPDLLTLIIEISSRPGTTEKITLAAVERSLLFPPGEEYSVQAMHELAAGGKFLV